jgi:threonine/homoserine/homoserine lactone efflux protein
MERYFRRTLWYSKWMELLEFVAEVVAVSASGVLGPGPLFFTNIFYGLRQGSRAGLKIALGHTIIELPLIILLAAGVFTSVASIRYAGMIGLVGGVAIIGFATMQIVGVFRKKNLLQTTSPIRGEKGPFVAGIVLSAFNPFFLVWWFTVGLKLIADSATFGLAAGIAILFALHIWMDYAWFVGTAYLASKGSSFLKSKYYRLMLLALATVLMYYGAYFSLTSLGNLP